MCIRDSQCQYGQYARGAAGNRQPVRKSTRWMSSAGLFLSELGRKCTGGHQHTALVSGRAAAAAVYPPQLC
eukprot:4306688-Alexandrium_andersonii.AAC.1